jgi:hypothetical protein
MTEYSKRPNTVACLQRFNLDNKVCQLMKPLLLAMLTAAIVGCDSGGSDITGTAAATSDNSTPCYDSVQESLTAYGTPDEIREDSFTFDDGSMMLIEEHIYTETRLIRSFGYKVEDSVCSTWEEGLTI